MTAHSASWRGGLADRWWTLAAPGYDRAVGLAGWHRLLTLLVADVTSGRLLDVGCGPAYLAPGLLARGIGYAGIDRNAAMLAQARRRITPSAGKVPLIRSDATALPFRTGSFDIVMAAGVLGLLDLHSRQAALREMARVTRGEVRLLEPFRRPGAPPHTLRARVIGLVPDRPIDLTELADAGLIPEVHGPPLLAGVYSRVHALPRSGGFSR